MSAGLQRFPGKKAAGHKLPHYFTPSRVQITACRNGNEAKLTWTPHVLSAQAWSCGQI